MGKRKRKRRVGRRYLRGNEGFFFTNERRNEKDKKEMNKQLIAMYGQEEAGEQQVNYVVPIANDVEYRAEMKALAAGEFSGEDEVRMGRVDEYIARCYGEGRKPGVYFEPNVEKIGAVEKLASLGEGAELGGEDEAEVEKHLGVGSVAKYKAVRDEGVRNEYLTGKLVEAYCGDKGEEGFFDRQLIAEMLGVESGESEAIGRKLREYGKKRVEAEAKYKGEVAKAKEIMRHGMLSGEGVKREDYEGLSGQVQAYIERRKGVVNEVAGFVKKFGDMEGLVGDVRGGYKVNTAYRMVHELARLQKDKPEAYMLFMQLLNERVQESWKSSGFKREYMGESVADALNDSVVDNVVSHLFGQGWNQVADLINAAKNIKGGVLDKEVDEWAYQPTLKEMAAAAGEELGEEEERKAGMLDIERGEDGKVRFRERGVNIGRIREKVKGVDWEAGHPVVPQWGSVDDRLKREYAAGLARAGILESHGVESGFEGDYEEWLKGERAEAIRKEWEEAGRDRSWGRRLAYVMEGLQMVKDGQFVNMGDSEVERFMEDSFGVIGASGLFIATNGIGSLIAEGNKAYVERRGAGIDNGRAILIGGAEGAAHWGANIWGLGKCGAYVHRAYDKAMNAIAGKVSPRGFMGKVLRGDEWLFRKPMFILAENTVMQAQEMLEPWMRYSMGNFVGGGQGRSLEETVREYGEASSWKQFMVGMPMSVLFGCIQGSGRSRARQVAVNQSLEESVMLDLCDDAESLGKIGLKEEEIKAISLEGDEKKRIELLGLGVKRVKEESPKLIEQLEKKYMVALAGESLAAELSESGEIPYFELVEGGQKVRIWEMGEKGGEKYKEYEKEEGQALITLEVAKWAEKQELTFKDAVLKDASIEWFSKDGGIEFKSEGGALTEEYLKNLAQKALYKGREEGDEGLGNRNEGLGEGREVEVLMALPRSWRQRVEIAVARGEISQAEAGGARAAAVNYTLETGKRVVRFYDGDMSYIELVEEMAELYTKGAMEGGMPVEFFVEGLRESQAWLREAGKLKGAELIGEEYLRMGGRELSEEEKSGQVMAVIEGMSKLMQAVYMGDMKVEARMSGVLKRFMKLVKALCEKVMDMVGLAAKWKVGVEEGKINGEFAEFVYKACGADFGRLEAARGGEEVGRIVKEVLGGSMGLKVSDRVEDMIGVDLRKAKAYDRRSGEELGKERYISTPLGKIDWLEPTEDKELKAKMKAKGLKVLPIRLKVGEHRGEGGFGYMHVLNHAKDFAELGESPLLYMYNTMRERQGVKRQSGSRYVMPGREKPRESQRLMVLELVEEDGCYSIVSCYPKERNQISKRELIIGGTAFRFPTNGTQGQFSAGNVQESHTTTGTHAYAEAPREKVAKKEGGVNIYEVEVRGKGKNGEEVRYVQVREGGANFGVIRGGIEEEVREEMRKIREEAERKGEYMKAPNGEASKLSEEQWCMVRTRGFRRWFGDWESMGYKKYFRERLVRLLREEALEKARGKTYQEIRELGFDTRVKPMAYIPMEIAELMGENVRDNLIYGSDFRFIEHIMNHHAEVEDYEGYIDDVLKTFAEPDRVYYDKKNKSYLFEKGEQACFLSVVRAPGEQERYIQWKSSYRSGRIKGERYQEIWNKEKVEPVGAHLHDLGPTLEESPSAKLSDLGSKGRVREVVREVKEENVSKVVDENGEPMVVTHATNAGPFTVFRRGERAGLSGKGIYFSPDGVGIWGKNIMRCFLNIRNPLTRENAPREVNNGGMSAVIADVFERFPQFDGVMLRRDEITVRDPNQIKSATDNRGRFDVRSGDITMAMVGEKGYRIEVIKKWEREAGAKKLAEVVEKVREKEERGEELSHEWHVIGEIPERVVREAEKVLNKDLGGYKLAIDETHIKHAMRKHGMDKGDQVALEWEDFRMIPDVVAWSDKIEIEKGEGSKADCIRFKKSYGKYEYRVVFKRGKERRKHPSVLNFSTEFIKIRNVEGEGVSPPRISEFIPTSLNGGNITEKGGKINGNYGLISERMVEIRERYGIKGSSELIVAFHKRMGEKMDREMAKLEKLLGGKGVLNNSKVGLLSGTRGVLNAVMETLPYEAREKMRESLEKADGVLEELGKKSKVDNKMKEELCRVAAGFFKRAGWVYKKHVQEEINGKILELLNAYKGEVNADSGYWEVSKIGAKGMERLRGVMDKAIRAKKEEMFKRVEELGNAMKSYFNEDGSEREIYSDEEFIDREQVMFEYHWWSAYGALFDKDHGSAEKSLACLDELTKYLSTTGEAWEAEQARKLEEWRVEGEELVGQLAEEVSAASLNAANEEMENLHNAKKGGIRGKLHLLDWVDNKVRKLERMSDNKRKGGEWFGKLLKDFVRISDKVGADEVAEQRRMQEVMMEIWGCKNQLELDAKLAEWNKKEDIGIKLQEIKEVEVEVSVDEAADMVARRKENPRYLDDVFSERAFVALEYELENRLREVTEGEEGNEGEKEEVSDRLKVKFIENVGEAKPLGAISKDQALYILMAMEQPNAYHSYSDELTPMQQKGWNNVNQRALEEYVGEEGKDLMEALFLGYSMQANKIRPIYEARYGMPFSKRGNYAPLRWIVTNNNSAVELQSKLGDDGLVQVGKVDAMLMARKKRHDRYLDTSQGALLLYWKQFSITNNWVNTAEFVERIKGVLSRQEVSNKLLVNLGGLDYYGFKAMLNDLEHGGVAKAAAFDVAEAIKNKVMGARAGYLLLGRMTTLVRNTLSFFNALHGCDLSVGAWLNGLRRVLSGKSVMGVGELFNSDLFAARKDGYTYEHILGLKELIGGKFGVLEQGVKKLGRANGVVDAYGNAVSFAAAFDHYYREGRKMGLEHEEAMVEARDKIEIGLATAQPISWVNTPEVMRKNHGLGSLNTFLMGESIQRIGTVVHLLRRAAGAEDMKGKLKWGNKALRSWFICGATFQAIGYLINNCLRPEEDEGEDEWENYLPGILYGPMNGVPILGTLPGKLLDEWMEEAFDLEIRGNVGVMGSELEYTAKELWRLWNDLENMEGAEDMVNARGMRAVNTAAGVGMVADSMLHPKGSRLATVLSSVGAAANLMMYYMYAADSNGMEWVEEVMRGEEE